MGGEDYDSDLSPEHKEREPSLKKKNSDGRKYSKDTNRQKKFSRSSEREDSQQTGRTNIINKIMKLYSVLDPSRTQFLEDMVYSESEEMHRNRLLNNLWDKNKVVDEQITFYHQQVEFVADKIKELHISQPKSDC
jgi:hypothetical protein